MVFKTFFLKDVRSLPRPKPWRSDYFVVILGCCGNIIRSYDPMFPGWGLDRIPTLGFPGPSSGGRGPPLKFGKRALKKPAEATWRTHGTLRNVAASPLATPMPVYTTSVPMPVYYAAPTVTHTMQAPPVYLQPTVAHVADAAPVYHTAPMASISYEQDVLKGWQSES